VLEAGRPRPDGASAIATEVRPFPPFIGGVVRLPSAS
jgi:hypothetical protein